MREKKTTDIAKRIFTAFLALLMMLSCAALDGLSGFAAFSGEESRDTFCVLSEHVHDDSCYDKILVCGLDESDGSAGHTHSESCYGTGPEPVCGLEESEPEAGHTHTGDCYREILTCGQEEHEHTLACYSDPDADLETADTWEATLPGMTGSRRDDVVAVAESQIGCGESASNYEVRDGQVKGYTRYGAWYGDPYGDWDGMFVSFCLYYAGVPETEMPRDSSASRWIDELRGLGLYADADYTPEPGDLIFLDTSGEGPDHVGIVAEAAGDTVIVIEGGGGDAVRENEYDPGDPRIAGYGILPEPSEGAPDMLSEGAGEETGEAAPETYAAGDTAFAVYSADDGSLTFYADSSVPAVGSTYGGKTVTDVYLGLDTSVWRAAGSVPWYPVRTEIRTAVFDASFQDVQPVSIACWFYDMTDLTSVEGTGYLDTSGATDMSYAFYNCSSLAALDVSGFDTSEVTDMSYMFRGCSGLSSLDVSGFDTSGVTDMSYMFYGCSGLTSLDVSTWDTSGVTAMSYMFRGCSGLASLEVGGFDTSRVTTMSYMFYGCGGLTSLDVSGFDTSRVTSMSYMFYNCSGITSLDVSTWDTSRVTNMQYMFCYCSRLRTIYSDDSNFVTTAISSSTYGNYMFRYCSSLVGGNGTAYSSSYYSYTRAHVDREDNKGYFTAKWNYGVFAVYSADDNSLTFYHDEGASLSQGSEYNGKTVTEAYLISDTAGCTSDREVPWYSVRTEIETVVFDGSFADVRPASTAYWFYGMSALTSVEGTQYLDTSGTADMSYMFRGCGSLAFLDVSGWDTSQVTDFSYMFSSCFSLRIVWSDDSNFVTAAAADGRDMFTGCACLAGGNGTVYSNDRVDCGMAHVDAEGDPGYFTAYGSPAGDGGGTVNGGTITISDDQGITITVTAKENDATGDGTLWTGESVTVNIRIENRSDAAYSDDLFRIYFRFDNDEVTMPVNFEDGASIEIHTSATDQASGNVSDVIIRMTVHYVGSGMWCWEIDGDDLVPGLTLDYNTAVFYANGTAGGTMTVLAEFVQKPEANGDHTPAAPEDSTISYTWETEPGLFDVSKAANGSADVSYAAAADGQDAYYITGLSFTITPGIAANRMDNSYGVDYVDAVSYEDVLVLDENLRWRDGLPEAVADGNYTITTGTTGQAAIGSLRYHIYISVTVDKTSCQLCDIYSAADIRDLAALSLYVDEDENLCLRWQMDNQSADMAGGTVEPSFTVDYGDEVILARYPDEISADMVFEIRNTVYATAAMHADGTDQAAKSAADTEAVPEAGDIAVSKARSGSTHLYMGASDTFTVTVENPGVLPYSGFRYLRDDLTTWLYIKPGDMQDLFDSDTTHSLTVTIHSATLCDTSFTSADYTYDYGPETVDDSALRTDAVLVIAWADPGDEDSDLLTLTVNGNDVYTIGAGGGYASISDALDAAGYLVTRNAAYSLFWDYGEDYTLKAGQSFTIKYTASVKDSFMYLTGDTRHGVTTNSSGYVATNPTLNSVYALDENGKTLDSAALTLRGSSSSTRYIRMDFAVEKSGTVFRNDTDVPEDGSVYPGDIVRYQVSVTHSGSSVSYTDLPWEDQMGSGQVLLVPAGLNSDMVCPDGITVGSLDTVTFDGVEYYVLSQDGTYENVVFATDSESQSSGTTQYAGTVTVSGNAAETMIYSHMSISGSTTNNIYYYVLVTAGGDDIDPETEGFTLTNYTYLNDHETHRLYDYVTLDGYVLTIDKEIVTEKGSVPESDSVERSSVLYGDDTVTYRLALTNTSLDGGTVTVNGGKIYDELPATVDSLPWTDERILDISLALSSGGTLCGADGSPLSAEETASAFKAWETASGDGSFGTGWYISGEGTGYILRWTDDLDLTYTGTLCIYVTVQYPSGDGWQALAGAYLSEGLVNTEYAYGLTSSVKHRIHLETATTAWLQKGVYDTGIYYKGTNYTGTYHRKTEDGLWQYTNTAGVCNYSSSNCVLYYGYVRYYTALDNTGDGNLYLNDIQDVLPEGFTLHTAIYAPACTSDLTLTDSDGNRASCVQCDVDYTTCVLEDGRQKITFTLSSDETGSGNLKYDASVGKYYLAPGEAVVIRYCVITNDYEDSADTSVNTAAMASYSEDYNGGGVTRYGGAVTVDWTDSYGRTHNDGTCDSIESDDAAAELGMTSSGGSDMWLTSDVTVYRGSPVPGISKTSGQAAAANNTAADWTVTVYNDGDGVMYDYTITDIMEYPYVFEGDLTYRVYSGNSEYSSNVGTSVPVTLTFGGRGTDGTGTYVEVAYRGSTGSSQYTCALYIDGDPETITVYGVSSSYAAVEVTLSLSTEEATGNEILSLTFSGSHTAILPGGYAVLTLQTNNLTSHQYNSMFYNTAYITPAAEFSRYDVTHGTYAADGASAYVDGDSVRASASVFVTYGHATTSQKSVNELDADGSLTDNAAYSEEPDYAATYISLESEDSVFRYTLEITNGDTESGTDYAMNRLVLIDNLPEVGDTYTANETVERDSAFKVVLADDPDLEVLLDGAVLTEGTDYTIEYSDKQTGFTTNDWAGTPSDDWYGTPEPTTRSFRVVFLFGGSSAVDMILTGSVVTVSFNAAVDEGWKEAGIDPGAVAWNSFGYQYTTNAGSTAATASPMAVGVQTPTAPVLVKELQTYKGTESAAAEDMDFTYVIYPGSTAVTGWETKEELIAALREAGIESYTEVTATVPAGKSASEPVSLDAAGLTVYSTETGAAIPDTWAWAAGQAYTVTELTGDTEYGFRSWNTTQTDNSFTFPYTNGVTFRLVNVNETDSRTLTIRKTDMSGNELDGAVFILTREADGTLRYYDGEEWTEEESTVSLGSLTLYKPLDGTYTLTENSAPDGFIAMTDPVVFTVVNGTAALESEGHYVVLGGDEDNVVIQVKNWHFVSLLPNAGGIGTVLLIAGAAVLIGGAIVLGRRRRRSAP